jgi:hypothetical protein
MLLTETQIVDCVARDERQPHAIAAESYGSDVARMLGFGDLDPRDFDPDDIRLSARCAFRFARLALESR